jgi:hypothetical protein
MTTVRETTPWQQRIDTRLTIVAEMAGIPEVILPDLLRVALEAVPKNTTADDRTHKMMRAYADIAVEMTLDIAAAHAPLRKLLDIKKEWRQDEESAATVAFRIAAVTTESVDMTMFVALQGVWALLDASYQLTANTGERNIYVSFEELVSRLALIIQIHRKHAGNKANERIVRRLVEVTSA